MTFQYTEQPPQSLDCSPYRNNLWRLNLRCTVEKLSGSDTFDVRWYQRLSSGVILDHGRPDLASSGENLNRVMFGGQWTGKAFSGEMVGEYWCQVVRTTRKPYEYLGTSNTVMICEPAYYSQQNGCSSNPVVDSSVVCADVAPLPTSSAVFSTSSTIQSTSATFLSSTHMPQTSSKPASLSSHAAVTSSSVVSIATSSSIYSPSSSSQATIVSLIMTNAQVTPSTTTTVQLQTSSESKQNSPSSSLSLSTSEIHKAVQSDAVSHTVTDTSSSSHVTPTAETDHTTKDVVTSSLSIARHHHTTFTMHISNEYAQYTGTALPDSTSTIPTTTTATRSTTKTSYKNVVESPSNPRLTPSVVLSDVTKESKHPIQLWLAIAALAVAMIMLVITIVLTTTTVVCNNNKRGNSSKESSKL